MNTTAQVSDLDNQALIEKIEETFDSPLVREMARRFADLLDDDRYLNYGHRELIATGVQSLDPLAEALADRLEQALDCLTELVEPPKGADPRKSAIQWLSYGGVEIEVAA